SRLIDRPLRPLFAEGWFRETQVIATVMSIDKETDPEIISLVGASLSLGISDIPWAGPIAAVRIGKIDGKLVCNPSIQDQQESTIDLIIAGSENGIIMVEGGADFASEDELLEALHFAEDSMKGVLAKQEEIIAEIGKTKIEVAPPETDETLAAKVKEVAEDKLKAALQIAEKGERYATLRVVKNDTKAALAGEYEGREKEISAAVGDLKADIMRSAVVHESKRVDGRGLTDVRQITCDVGVLPRTHGSGLFTRGETQAMVVATLGTSDDEQRIDALGGWEYKRFMLHYNFPPYCVGEAKFLRGPGRREIGHGALAERAVRRILPGKDDFPYTVRVVSDILESNGSSSMASVCGASLSLMDAGVPISEHVAGIAMGLIKEGDKVAILSDILGDEDHLGDMDFKVAGSERGVTALQMDIKIGGVTQEIMKNALYQARDGRMVMLAKMNEAISEPNSELSEYAPRIVTLQVKTEKIKDIIGPGGKMIRSIVQQTGAKIDIEDSGQVNIASADGEALRAALAIIEDIVREPEADKLYMGTVVKIMDFGAFVEIFPGTDGLVHISQLAKERVENVRDILSEGDQVLVKCIGVERDGKIRLSRKEALGESLPDIGE
ncbi:MAG: polyribonucleotide nucleotidyltransferase, partial [Thermodesulfobacteriota bacterium]